MRYGRYDAHALPLAVEGLHFSYGSSCIYEGIDLDIERAELLGIVGPNGAGKTTLLKLLSGSLKPDHGHVRVYGADLRSLRPREQARLIAMVPQNPAAPEGFTALELVLMGRNPHLSLLQWEGPEDAAIAHQALRLTGAEEFADRLVTSLSGGEHQRVIIARALAQQAPVLLLDEPTAHLDIGSQAATMDVIEGIRRDAGVTVVAAVHDLTLAAQYCDRVAVLDHGSLLAIGAPRSVMTEEILSRAFGADICVMDHPVHGTPVILHRGKRSVSTPR